MNSKLLVALLATLALSGCADISAVRGGSALEAAWQASNALDFSQTITIARDPYQYHETNPILGMHPSERDVGVYWALYSALHFAVAGWLAREADATGNSGWRRAYYIFEGVTLAFSVRNVVNNARLGITPFGPHWRSHLVCTGASGTRCLSWQEDHGP